MFPLGVAHRRPFLNGVKPRAWPHPGATPVKSCRSTPTTHITHITSSSSYSKHSWHRSCYLVPPTTPSRLYKRAPPTTTTTTTPSSSSSSRSRQGRCGVVSVSAAAAAPPASTTKPFKDVPEPLKGWPWLGPVNKIKLDEVFATIHAAFKGSGADLMKVELYGVTVVYLRHPRDIALIMKNPTRFVKDGTGIDNIAEWLGTGLVTDLDHGHHAAMRDLLLPAFRAQSVKDMVPLFVKVGSQLAETMLMEPGNPLDIEPLARRATLDVIGLAAFGYDFKSLATAQQQMKGPHTGSSSANDNKGATSSNSSSNQNENGLGPSAGSSTSSSSEPQVDVIKVLDGMLLPAMLLVFKLPLPRFMTPGIQQYQQGVELLDQVVSQVMQEVRSRGIDPNDCSLLSFMLRQQEAERKAWMDSYGSVPSTSGNNNNSSSGGSSSEATRNKFSTAVDDATTTSTESGLEGGADGGAMSTAATPLPSYSSDAEPGRRCPVLPPHRHDKELISSSESSDGGNGPLHAANGSFSAGTPASAPPSSSRSIDGESGVRLVDDKQIRDQLMTFMFAGSDTTASTLAFLLYELSCHPDDLARAVEEVDGKLGGKPPSSWTPDMFQGMSFLSAAANETLRLYPAAVEMARIACGEEEVGGYLIPKGMLLLPDVYCMHRHESLWSRPEEWLPQRWLSDHHAELGPRHPEAFMPFSTGPRSCIGRYFAQLELLVLAAVVLHKLDLSAAQDCTVKLMQKFTLSSRDGVKIIVKPKAAAVA